jgi:hypothetical protein
MPSSQVAQIQVIAIENYCYLEECLLCAKAGFQIQTDEYFLTLERHQRCGEVRAHPTTRGTIHISPIMPIFETND